MEYVIQTVTPQSGKITFKWEEVKRVPNENGEMEAMIFPYEKEIAFTISGTQCYIPEVESRHWAGLGHMSVKRAMSIPESACCCNPDHSESLEVRLRKLFPKQEGDDCEIYIQPAVKELDAKRFAKKEENTVIPAKEKIENIVSPVVSLLDRRKKVSDETIAMIRASNKSARELADEHDLTPDAIRKYRRGDRR
jgi:hypothetical protein